MNVKATRLTASGAVSADRRRVKGIYIVCGGTAGSVVLEDSNGGTAVCTIDTPALATETISITFPGDGILCETSIYAAITNATFVTVFYG